MTPWRYIGNQVATHVVPQHVDIATYYKQHAQSIRSAASKSPNLQYILDDQWDDVSHHACSLIFSTMLWCVLNLSTDVRQGGAIVTHKQCVFFTIGLHSTTPVQLTTYDICTRHVPRRADILYITNVYANGDTGITWSSTAVKKARKWCLSGK